MSRFFKSRVAPLFFAIGLAGFACGSQAASFGINFGSDNDGWGPYYVNPANGTSAFNAPGFSSAFGVVAADWYEPGPAPATSYLPGSPSSVNFKPASMGSGGVNIAYSSYNGPPGSPGSGYTWSAYGFANANQYATVDVDPQDGQPDIDPNTGWYAYGGDALPTNGQPVSGENMVLAGFLFATGDLEYGDPWPAQDINVSISGLNSIASSYTVKLLASAQNGNPYDPLNGVHAFTPATVSDNAANSETVSFSIMDDHPNFWSYAQSLETDADPDTHNPYVSVAGMGVTATSFTGDTLTIHLAGSNEYYDENTADFTRTTLAGIVIEYNSIVTPTPTGDFDNDGDVDGADFVAWQTHYPMASGATLADGDADGDGKVDGADFAAWQTAFPSSPATTAVPEPNALLLAVVAGLGGLMFRSQRRTGSKAN